MDRLSAYAAREAEALTPEQKQQNEEAAMTSLLERLQLEKDKPAQPAAEQQNGEASDSASVAPSETTTAVDSVADSQAETVNGDRPAGRGIPEDIRLFEIFNEQVQSLVKLQRLPLADAVALMVSLANLALYVYSMSHRIQLTHLQQYLSGSTRLCRLRPCIRTREGLAIREQRRSTLSSRSILHPPTPPRSRPIILLNIHRAISAELHSTPTRATLSNATSCCRRNRTDITAEPDQDRF